MKLGDSIRLQQTKRRLRIPSRFIFFFDPCLFQFQMVGPKLSKELVFMDIVETPDVAVVQAVPASRKLLKIPLLK